MEPKSAPTLPSPFQSNRWYSDLWFMLFLGLYVWVLQAKLDHQPRHYETVDGYYYAQLADNLLSGKPFVIEGMRNRKGNAFSPYPPGYPALLALGRSLTGFSYAEIAPAIHLFLLAILALFWRRVAPLWPLAVAFSVDTAFELSSYIWSEFTFTLLLVFTALATTRLKDKPGMAWATLLLACLTFLVRFAAIGVVIFWGLNWVSARFRKPKSDSESTEAKKNRGNSWVWLTIGFGVFIGLYFVGEWLVFGQPTGGDRYPNTESATGLFHDLVLEMGNQFSFFKDADGSSRVSFLWGMAMQLFFIGWAIFTKNKRPEIRNPNSPAVGLILLGLSYWAFMIPLRWYFYFAETFDFRLLGPGGILLLLGTLTWFSNHYTVHRPKTLLVLVFCSAFFFTLPKKEMVLRYQEWFWLKQVKPAN